jgi:hypothetical protein
MEVISSGVSILMRSATGSGKLVKLLKYVVGTSLFQIVPDWLCTVELRAVRWQKQQDHINGND